MALTEVQAADTRHPFRQYLLNPNCFFEVHKFRHRVEWEPEYHSSERVMELFVEAPQFSLTGSFRRSQVEMSAQNYVETACLTRAINRCMN